MADDNKTDTLALWSLDRKNRYYLRDKTGLLNGIGATTPVFMLEGDVNGEGTEGNIAIHKFLHEVKGGGFNFIETTIYNHEQTMAATDTSLTNEIANRIAADTAITTNLNAEISARTSADTTLTNSITTETNARIAADTTLTTNLNSEIANRIAADSTISTSVTTETTARIAADNSLNTLIVNLTTRVATLEAQMANLRGKA